MITTGKDIIDFNMNKELQHEPLLEKSEEPFRDLTQMRLRRSPRSCWPYLIHLMAFTAYSLGYFAVMSRSRQAAHVYSPADAAVRYHKVKFNGSLDATSAFKGEPRPELDQAWGRLFENINLRLSRHDLESLNTSSIALHDGSGYFGMIGAYHHLHCLKYIRQVLWDDHYHVSPVNRQQHLDHCIDDIRQALMCHADPSVLTFDWRPDWRHPWPRFEVEKTCVDWEALDDWASERSFDVLDQTSLVHPQLGIAYPVIDGVRENVASGPGVHVVWPEAQSRAKG